VPLLGCLGSTGGRRFLGRCLDDSDVNGFFPSHPDDLRISTTAEVLRRGLIDLQFQDAVLDRACAHAP